MNILNHIPRLVFRWLAIPWIQLELDAYVLRFNRTQRRANKAKVLPRGIPDVIAAHPQQYGSSDFKVFTLTHYTNEYLLTAT